MQWLEHGKAGRIGPAQWESIDGMYEGVGDRGEAPDSLRSFWYSLVCTQPVLQRITVDDRCVVLLII